MKLVHFDSHRKSTFVYCGFDRRSFQPYYVLLVSLSSVRCVSRNDLWALMYPTEPILCVCKSSRIEWTEWNEMNGWMNSINGQVYLWFLKLWPHFSVVVAQLDSAMQMCGGWNDTRAAVQPSEYGVCVRLLYGNPCAINSFHAFPFWSITPCMHIRTRFAKAYCIVINTNTHSRTRRDTKFEYRKTMSDCLWYNHKSSQFIEYYFFSIRLQNQHFKNGKNCCTCHDLQSVFLFFFENGCRK